MKKRKKRKWTSNKTKSMFGFKLKVNVRSPDITKGNNFRFSSLKLTLFSNSSKFHAALDNVLHDQAWGLLSFLCRGTCLRVIASVWLFYRILHNFQDVWLWGSINSVGHKGLLFKFHELLLETILGVYFQWTLVHFFGFL